MIKTNGITGAPSLQNYSPEIDGLRAVAVLSVILFHIDKTWIPGGFVGVDIFFVISGYLISLHILRDMERGCFSLTEFYRRRVKRIVPAMLVVVAVTLVLTQLVFRPEDAKACAISAVSSLLSLANVFFWLYKNTSYFAASSNQIPLLHLWSLGVEEQFYIFWPIVLMLVYRKALSLEAKGKGQAIFIGSVILIAIGSFCLGEYFFDYSPKFVYYMLPTRAGELLIGALAAFIVLRCQPAIPMGVATVVAVLGMLLIGSSLFLLSEEQVFPGFRAVPPTLGTAMLILSGYYRNSLPIRLLKLQPLAFIGLISYSAYLWHWPLLAFYHYGHTELSSLAKAVIFVLTILLAWASYRWIECPARRSSKPARQIFVYQYIRPAAALSALAVITISSNGYGLRWFSQEYKTSLAVLSDRTKPAYGHDYVCQRPKITEEDLSDPKCIVGAADNGKPPVALLWGDSNASHYIGMLNVFASEQGFRFRNEEAYSCPPIDSDPTEFVAANRRTDCRKSNDNVKQAIDNYPVVILSALWSSYQGTSNRFTSVLFDSVKRLAGQGKLVIIIGQTPKISTYDRLCWEKKLSFPFMNECAAPAVPLSEEVASINATLKQFADNTENVEYFDANRYLCPNEAACSAFDKTGKAMYYDHRHLALSASYDLGHLIYQAQGVPDPFTKIPSL